MKGAGASQPLRRPLARRTSFACNGSRHRLSNHDWTRPAIDFAPARRELPPRRFQVEKKTSLYAYSYDWPKEAVAIPAAQPEASQTRMKQGSAGPDRNGDVRQEGWASWFPPNGYDIQHGLGSGGAIRSPSVAQRWTLAVSPAAPMAMAGRWRSCGTAQLNREISIQNLLRQRDKLDRSDPPAVLRAAGSRAARSRREEPVKKDDLFGNCPELQRGHRPSGATTDKNRRFDHILVTADQYVAGPYAEGPYEICAPDHGDDDRAPEARIPRRRSSPGRR